MKRTWLVTSIAAPLVGIAAVVAFNCGSSTGKYVAPDSGGTSGSSSGGSSTSSSGGSSSSSSGGASSGDDGGGTPTDGSGGDDSSSGSSTDAGVDAGDMSVTGILGIKNTFGESVADSFMMFGCYAQAQQDCLTTPGGVCPASLGTTAPLEVQGLVSHEYFKLGGTAGTMYVATVHVDGILEAKYYENGVRFVGNADPTNPNDPAGIDTFYTGGDPVNVENYNVYKITVRQAPAAGAEAGSGTELQHYYINSFPKTAIAYENHETFPISWTHDIPVPGGGEIEYLTEDRNCHAVDNCGIGPRSVSCGNSTMGPRNVPNEPTLVIPTTYMGQQVASMNLLTGASQPFHAQIVHITVTAVHPM